MTQQEPEHKKGQAAEAVSGPGSPGVEQEGQDVPAAGADTEGGIRGTVTMNLVPVRFRNDRPSVHCDTGDLKPDIGEWVVVPCEHCSEVGQVSGLPVRMELPADVEIPCIERLATTREIELFYQNLENEKHARKVCQECINALGLEMKLVRVESLFDGSKIIFYYSADGRVDFRELVKDLVRRLKTRVEMCQIGIRHEAKMTGGIGSCGRVLCCTSFLKSFDPVSIKMAKMQNLPLNPSKISGFCGRLLCCLVFEYDTYREYAKNLPSMGNICDSPSGEGKVIRRNILKKTVSLSTEKHGVVEFTNAELEDFRQRKEQGLPPRQAQGRDYGNGVSHDNCNGDEKGKGQGQKPSRQAARQGRKGQDRGGETSSKRQKGKKKESAGSAARETGRKAKGRSKRRGGRKRGRQGGGRPAGGDKSGGKKSR